MGYLNQFPNTHFYDQDLGWLIKEYKRLEDNYEVLVKIYELIQKQITDITLEQLQKWLDDGTLEHLLTNSLSIAVTYSTTTEMINKGSTLSKGMKVNTLGYNTVNDNGGGLFYIDNAPTSNKFYIKLTENLFAILIDEGFINIKQAGITDLLDIQTLLDMYKRVYIPNGTYTVESPITLTQGYEIWGDGKSTIINHSATNTNAVFVTSKASNVYRGCKIHDLQLSGGYSGSVFIESNQCCSEFYNLFSENYIGTCIQCLGNAFLNRIHNCEFYGRLIDGVEPSAQSRYAIYIDTVGGGEYIYQNDIVAYTTGIYINQCLDASIQNNNISECSKEYFTNNKNDCACIYVKQANRISIQDNYLESFDANIFGNIKNVLLMGNYINGQNTITKESAMHGITITDSVSIISMENTYLNISNIAIFIDDNINAYGQSIGDSFGGIIAPISESKIALINNTYYFNNFPVDIKKIYYYRNSGTTFTNGGTYTLDHITTENIFIVLSDNQDKIILLNNTFDVKNIYLGSSTSSLMIPLQGLGILTVYKVDGRYCYYYTKES